jgi:hypothetical protein
MTVLTPWFGRPAPFDDDTGAPVGINLAVGAATLTAAQFVAAAVPIADPQWRYGVVAVALGLFALFTPDRLAVAALIVPTWMTMNGFLVNHLGFLSWHGQADLDRLAALVAAACVGLAVAEAHRRMHDLQERWQLGTAVQEMRTEFNRETKQRA